MLESHTTTRNWLKEKLRAHGVPGWRDELLEGASRDESAVQLATWEGEGGRTVTPAAKRTFIAV